MGRIRSIQNNNSEKAYSQRSVTKSTPPVQSALCRLPRRSSTFQVAAFSAIQACRLAMRLAVRSTGEGDRQGVFAAGEPQFELEWMVGTTFSAMMASMAEEANTIIYRAGRRFGAPESENAKTCGSRRLQLCWSLKLRRDHP